MIKLRGLVGIKGASKGKGGIAGELDCEKLLVWGVAGAPCPGFGQGRQGLSRQLGYEKFFIWAMMRWGL